MEKVTRISPIIKCNARKLRNNMTDAEQILWSILRNKQMNGYKFRRQHPIGNYIVDFVCIEANLVIELDGGQHGQQVNYDNIRMKYLEQEGFYVLRFWNNEVFQNLESVKHEIWKWLISNSYPHPNPPP